jgi:hypothetical protein
MGPLVKKILRGRPQAFRKSAVIAFRADGYAGQDLDEEFDGACRWRLNAM